MRVGLVTPGWPGHNTPNGIATAVYHMAIGLKLAGHLPVIIARSIDGVMPKDIPVVPVSRRSWSLVQKLKHRLGGLGVIKSIISESIADAVETAKCSHGIDVVLVEETWGCASSTIQREIAPVVVVLHGPWLLHKMIQGNGSVKLDQLRQAREAACITQASAIISPSHSVLNAMEQSLDLTAVPRRVIPNAFALDEQPAVLPAQGPALFVGRFDYHKGGDTIIKAFGKLYASHPEARLTFVGPDKGVCDPNGNGVTITMTETLAALKKDAGDAVSTLGRQSKTQIAALRQTHPIAVIASRYENLSYTMLEAMAAGQAIVSTRVGGLAEVFEDGKTALLVPPESPQAMADAIGRLIEDPILVTRLGHAAKLRLSADFHPQTIAEHTVHFLREVL